MSTASSVLAYASPTTAPGTIPAPWWLVALHGNVLALSLALGLTPFLGGGGEHARLMIVVVGGGVAAVQLVALIPFTVRHVLCNKPSRPVRLLALAAAPVAVFVGMILLLY